MPKNLEDRQEESKLSRKPGRLRQYQTRFGFSPLEKNVYRESSLDGVDDSPQAAPQSPRNSIKVGRTDYITNRVKYSKENPYYKPGEKQ